jgi:hypothetical protein
MSSKLKLVFGVFAFIVWTLWTIEAVELSKVWLEGAMGAVTIIVFVLVSKLYSRQWVYYVFLVLLGIAKHYTEEFSYFFYLTTASVMLGFYISKYVQEAVENEFN